MDITRRIFNLGFLFGIAGAGLTAPTGAAAKIAARRLVSGYDKAVADYRLKRRRTYRNHLAKIKAWWRQVESQRDKRRIAEARAKARKTQAQHLVKNYVTEKYPVFIPPEVPEDIRERYEANQKKFRKPPGQERYENALAQAEQWRQKNKNWPEETAGVPRYSPVVHLRAMLKASALWGYVVDLGQIAEKEEELGLRLDTKLRLFYHPAKAADPAAQDREKLWGEIIGLEEKLNTLTKDRDTKREKLFFEQFTGWLKEFKVPADYAAGILAVEATNKGKGWYQSGTLGSFIPISAAIGYPQIIGETFFDFMADKNNEKWLMREMRALQQRVNEAAHVKKIGKLISHLEKNVFPKIKENKGKFGEFRLTNEGRGLHALLADAHLGPLAQAMFMANSWEKLKQKCIRGPHADKLLTPAFGELANLLGLERAIKFSEAPKDVQAANFVSRDEFEKNFSVLSAGDFDDVLAKLGKMMKDQILNYKATPGGAPAPGPKFIELFLQLGGELQRFAPHRPLPANDNTCAREPSRPLKKAEPAGTQPTFPRQG